VMGVGGSLDFVSGNIRRAPRWIQRAGLEGLYRLVQQPSLMRVRRITESIAAIRYFFE
jgi:N-acetylglucosaminyldiphosphoundecaprenol N-acetyl-beta-D-mannosaminyltransferase